MVQLAEVRAVLFTETPPGTPEAEVVQRGAPARRLRDAFEPIAMHQVWCERVAAAMAPTGLDFFPSYAWGRAAVLGDVEPAVAASAFAVFEPGRIGGAVAAGQAAIGRDDILALLDRETIASLRALLGPDEADSPAMAHAADVLSNAVAAADGTGRPLFCGVRSLAWPEDPVGRMWRACHALREHRGDGHTAAFVAAGFDPVRMNILTELWLHYPLGGYSASRAWGAEATEAALARLRADGLLDGDVLTPAGRAVRDDIEAATDRAQQSVIDAIGAQLDPVVGALDRWSAACVAGGFFPPDRRKRHAG